MSKGVQSALTDALGPRLAELTEAGRYRSDVC